MLGGSWDSVANYAFLQVLMSMYNILKRKKPWTIGSCVFGGSLWVCEMWTPTSVSLPSWYTSCLTHNLAYLQPRLRLLLRKGGGKNLVIRCKKQWVEAKLGADDPSPTTDVKNNVTKSNIARVKGFSIRRGLFFNEWLYSSRQIKRQHPIHQWDGVCLFAFGNSGSMRERRGWVRRKEMLGVWGGGCGRL